MNRLRKKRNLDSYLDSLGSDIPIDYADYTEGNMHQDRCVFCEEPRSSYALHRINLINMTSHDTGAHTCEECAIYCETMLERELGLTTAQNVFVEYRATAAAQKSNSNSRWTALLEKLTFDYEAYKYLVHLNPNKDRFITDECNRCYICSKLADVPPYTDPYSKWVTIEIPVDLGSGLATGKVFICDTCQAYDLSGLENKYREYLDQGKLFRYRCHNCKEHFYVTASENDYREDASRASNLSWLCPQCTYSNIDGLQTYNWLYLFENESPRHDLMERFLNTQCYGCERSFYLDLMIDPKVLENRHFVTLEKFICKECAKEGMKSFLLDDLVFHFADKIFIKFDKLSRVEVDDTWKYEVFRIRGGKIESILTADSNESEVAEAVLIAYDEVYILYFGKQTELWS